ncbi:hypothetical protein ACGFJ7_41275 [Actinoplanes sp. NPDC048988]|uniref:hypothetical protein n=1 Tax=Actinoplanes sp. NPDC048988 TaxID=3363901 RepID=UPI0037228E86
MALTGRPLILLMALMTLTALGATVFWWRRSGRLRFVVRPLGLLLTEILLLVTAGVWFNRTQQFYPTWSALLDDTESVSSAPEATAGNLDSWLAGQSAAGTGQAWSFEWHPTEPAQPGPLVVGLPDGYLAHPTRRYPVVMIVGAPDATIARGLPEVVSVSVPVTSVTAETATSLPRALERDVRVTGQRWAMVAPIALAPALNSAITVAPGRFPAWAFVGSGTAPKLPAGVEVHRAGTWAAAVRWAVAQTPMPL